MVEYPMPSVPDKYPVPSEMRPLCVDLDGTLIYSDSFFEALVLLVRSNPLYVLLFPFLLLRGRAGFKQFVANRVVFNAALLPYNEPFLDFLRKEHARGRSLVLATGSNYRLAKAVADNLEIFDKVLASDGQVNLTGRLKALRLEETFGPGGFDYAGNARIDEWIWSRAHTALVVNAPRALAERVAAQKPGTIVFDRPPGSIREVLRLLRPHQWSKNLIVFVPVITSHEMLNPKILAASAWAFLAFCCAASAAYLINDLCDLDADRAHATKHRRPLASGTVPILWAVCIVPLLIVLASLFAVQSTASFCLVLLVYFIVTLLYSLFIKSLLLVDVVCLSLLYTIRIIGGLEATHITYSSWLLAFALFMFFSLALVKRYSELYTIGDGEIPGAKGRGYLVGDMGQISMLGTASGLIAVLVLALYVNSTIVQTLYQSPMLLLLLCPLLLYWVGRIWVLAHRGLIHEDPILFAVHDRASYVVVALAGAIMAIANVF